MGCVLSALQLRTRETMPFPRVLFLAIFFIALDQTMKFLVEKTIPLQASIPIIHGWLHLSHERNLHGSWVLAQFGAHIPVPLIILVQVLIPLLLLLMILIYRHYIVNKRYSLWAVAAFLGIFCGLGSWALDIFSRGFILDTLLLPSIVAADLKDIYLAIGIAAMFAEMIDNPSISFRWDGWHEETRGIARWIKSLLRFSIQDFRNGCLSMRRWLRKQ